MPSQSEEYKLSWKVVSVKKQEKAGLGRKNCQTAMQIWQSLCQPNWEPQSRDHPLKKSPVERKWRGACRTFWLSHLLRLLWGKDGPSSNWGGPENLNRWFSQLGNESFLEGGADLCMSAVSATDGKTTQLLAKSRNERLDLYQNVFILGLHMELGNR